MRSVGKMICLGWGALAMLLAGCSYRSVDEAFAPRPQAMATPLADGSYSLRVEGTEVHAIQKKARQAAAKQCQSQGMRVEMQSRTDEAEETAEIADKTNRSSMVMRFRCVPYN